MSVGSKGCSDSFSKILDRIIRDPRRAGRIVQYYNYGGELSYGPREQIARFDDVLGSSIEDYRSEDRRLVDETYWIILRELTSEGYLKYVIKDADEIFISEIPEDSIFDDEVLLNHCSSA